MRKKTEKKLEFVDKILPDLQPQQHRYREAEGEDVFVEGCCEQHFILKLVTKLYKIDFKTVPFKCHFHDKVLIKTTPYC